MNDRLQETLNGQTTAFAMDLNTGLTQVLSDGTNNYIYGNGRIAQVNAGTEYFLGDALGSVRQLTNNNGAVTYASAYDPYGVTTQTYGASQTAYGYTNEYTDSYIKLIYLRSRMYDPASGRFTTKDSWQGDYNRPLSLNRWMYVEGNPVNYIDPSGFFITLDDINQGNAVYSCNCGWIDFKHAGPETSNQIHDAIKTAQQLSPPKNTFLRRYRPNSVVIQVNLAFKKRYLKQISG